MLLKHIVLLAGILVATGNLHTSCAQSFEKGTHVLEPTLGLAIYSVSYEEEDIFGRKYTETGGAGSVPLELGYEYGVLNWLGVGGMLRYQPFLDSSGADLTVRSIEIGPRLNFHVLRTDKVDLLASLSFGLSSFSWNETDRDAFGGVIERELRATGGFFALQGKVRWYFADNVGLNLGLGFASQSYTEGDYSDNVGNRVENNPLPLRASGVLTTLGLQFRF